MVTVVVVVIVTGNPSGIMYIHASDFRNIKLVNMFLKHIKKLCIVKFYGKLTISD